MSEENLELKFENVSISSLIKDESVGLQGQNAPLLLPGTVYKIYGILVGVILVLLFLIRLIVKRDSVAASIKKRKLIKKYKKNKKETLKNLGKLLKKNEISDVDFAAEKTMLDAELSVTLRLAQLLRVAIFAGWGVLIILIKHKRRIKKQRKQAENNISNTNTETKIQTEERMGAAMAPFPLMAYTYVS